MKNNNTKSGKRKKRKKIVLKKRFFIILFLLFCLIAGSIFAFTRHQKQERIIHAAIDKADQAAVQYDYDRAMSLLKEYGDHKDVQKKLDEYSEKKSDTRKISPGSVTHVFFHSLVVDPTRGFSLTGKSGWDAGTPGFCQWMTTVNEFNAILEEMYDRGYVLVDIKDLCDKDMNPGTIRLPKSKKAFVLSLDDLSYYHSYDNRGTASKLILNNKNKPVCEYYTKEGTRKTGAYDAVPLLDRFIREHPDFSYHGAKGTIALTGYNGVLGYRTDTTYRDETSLDEDQKKWLEAHPDFDWEKECKEARKVAKALKKDGWRFASHTWGHIRAGQTPLEGLQRDTEKWKERVEPIVGKTDIIIFAHGEDIALPEVYATSDKFKYLSSEGYRYFCNVDGRRLTTVIGDSYFHQGRRNLDGYRMYQAKYNGSSMLDDLFDVNEVWDKNRPSNEELYDLSGKSQKSTTGTQSQTSSDTKNQSSSGSSSSDNKSQSSSGSSSSGSKSQSSSGSSSSDSKSQSSSGSSSSDSKSQGSSGSSSSDSKSQGSSGSSSSDSKSQSSSSSSSSDTAKSSSAT